MKKNAGISTIMVTGMAAFVSIFVMALLIVLRSAIGPGSDSSKAIDDAETRGNNVISQFNQDVANADISIYWDTVNSALICVSSDHYIFTWLQNENIYRTAMNYSSDKLSDEGKFAEAKDKVKKFFEPVKEGQEDEFASVRGTIQTVATQFRAYSVAEMDTEGKAKLTVRVKYTEDKKQKILEKVAEQSYSDKTKTYKAAHQ